MMQSSFSRLEMCFLAKLYYAGDNLHYTDVICCTLHWRSSRFGKGAANEFRRRYNIVFEISQEETLDALRGEESSAGNRTSAWSQFSAVCRQRPVGSQLFDKLAPDASYGSYAVLLCKAGIVLAVSVCLCLSAQKLKNCWWAFHVTSLAYVLWLTLVTPPLCERCRLVVQ